MNAEFLRGFWTGAGVLVAIIVIGWVAKVL